MKFLPTKKEWNDFKLKSWFYLFAIVIISCGMSLNLTALKFNDMRMPVYNSDYVFDTTTHFTFYDKDEVSFFYLTDILYFPSGYYSIGDITMFSGFFLLFFYEFKDLLLWKNNKKSLNTFNYLII